MTDQDRANRFLMRLVKTLPKGGPYTKKPTRQELIKNRHDAKIAEQRAGYERWQGVLVPYRGLLHYGSGARANEHERLAAIAVNERLRRQGVGGILSHAMTYPVFVHPVNERVAVRLARS